MIMQKTKTGTQSVRSRKPIAKRKKSSGKRVRLIAKIGSNEMYRALFEGAPDPILLIDAETLEIVDFNAKACVQLGYSRKELKKLKVNDFEVIESEREIKKHAKEILRCGKGSFESKHKTKNGKILDVCVNVHVVSIDGRKYIQGIYRDITEHKQKDEKLKNTYQYLQKALDELKRTQSRIVQRERLMALGQMVSGVAHEFNNALVPIIGYSNLFLNKPELLDNREETIKMLKDMNTAATDASQSILSMREFYRPITPMELEVLDVAGEIENVINITRIRWKDEMERKNVSIKIKSNVQGKPKIKVNGSQLREVLINLIFNAVDAMPKGGTITIRSFVHQSGHGVVLEVEDTGCGMTEEIRQRCMELFFTTKTDNGVGLGLAIVHGFVLRNNGSLDIKSKRGKGTVITINLPMTKEHPAKTTSAQKAVKKIAPLKILFMDDEPSVRSFVMRSLSLDGHTVETAGDGFEGLKKYRKGAFDVVITDQAMPGMNGLKVAEAVKKIDPGIPVIMLSGFDEITDKDDMSSVVDMVLEKPITLSKLEEAIGQVVRNKRC